MDQGTTVSGEKPLWRKIVDFPLVAMLIALALVIACVALATLLMRSVVPAVPGLATSLEFDLVTIPLLANEKQGRYDVTSTNSGHAALVTVNQRKPR